ncbi:hypothetical protein LTR03_017869, partial [Friedmanniomyces endolithicus]
RDLAQVQVVVRHLEQKRHPMRGQKGQVLDDLTSSNPFGFVFSAPEISSTLAMVSPALDELPYTLQNLPYGIISTSSETKPRCAVAIGQHAVDLAKYSKNGNLFDIESGHNFMFQQMFSEACSLCTDSLQERTAC